MIGSTIKGTVVLENPFILITPVMKEQMRYLITKFKPGFFIEPWQKNSPGYDFIINKALQETLKKESIKQGFKFVDHTADNKLLDDKIKVRQEKQRALKKEIALREKAQENLLLAEMERIRKEEAKNDKTKEQKTSK